MWASGKGVKFQVKGYIHIKMGIVITGSFWMA